MVRRFNLATLKPLCLALAAMALFTLCLAQPAKAAQVDSKLLLMLDVSGSVNESEFKMQLNGYVEAFRSATIQNLITDTSGGALGSTAIALGFFASEATIAIPWTVISSSADAAAFADTIAATARPRSNGKNGIGQMTNVTGAINLATSYMDTGGYTGREVIDISGDGTQNVYPYDTGAARDAAVAQGVTINAISIGSGDSITQLDKLISFYQNDIKGGEDSFTMHAKSFETFGDAIKDKLARELDPTPPGPEVPEPGSMLLLGSGLVALVGWRRRRKPAQN